MKRLDLCSFFLQLLNGISQIGKGIFSMMSVIRVAFNTWLQNNPFIYYNPSNAKATFVQSTRTFFENHLNKVAQLVKGSD